MPEPSAKGEKGSEAEGDASGQSSRPDTTVLLVDDEPDILESIQDLIEASFPDLHVVCAPDGYEALKLLEGQAVDLIVADHKMPKMSGVKLLTEAHRMYPEVPRILMTAYGSLDVAVKAINEAHVDSFFLKPFQVEVIVTAVSNALGLEPASPPSR